MKSPFITTNHETTNKLIVLDSPTLVNMFKLPQKIIDYLWKRIEVAKKNPISMKKNLAGNISCSYKLDDPQDLIVPYLFKKLDNFNDRQINNFLDNEIQNVIGKRRSKTCIITPYLDSMWVNFQKKYEFQPLHTHKGVFSFVIWMEIPYDNMDESKLPFTQGTMNNVSGNFSFTYPTCSSREIVSRIIELSPRMNGYCCFFPSDLSHQVYPFYTSDKERISISGNIMCKVEE